MILGITILHIEPFQKLYLDNPFGINVKVYETCLYECYSKDFVSKDIDNILLVSKEWVIASKLYKEQK